MMRITEITSQQPRLYHISNNPNLVIDPAHDLRQGQMGKGFYVTADPRAWKDGNLGGKRSYTYLVDPTPLRIARGSNFPNTEKLTDWAIKSGYMRMAPVVRPTPNGGETILDMNGQPLIRPEITDAGKQFLWQDPMTGNSMNGLENEYLRAKGFNAYEALYSPEGHQIIIFDPSVIKLRRIK